MSSAGRDLNRAVVGSEVSAGDAQVPMMESAEVGCRHDTLLRRRLEGAWVRAVLVQRLMGARGVVMGQVSLQQPVEAPFVQDHEVMRHSLRIDPMTRSTKGFCQGARGAMSTSRINIRPIRRANSAP
jgi:hypothetical protein